MKRRCKICGEPFEYEEGLTELCEDCEEAVSADDMPNDIIADED